MARVRSAWRNNLGIKGSDGLLYMQLRLGVTASRERALTIIVTYLYILHIYMYVSMPVVVYIVIFVITYYWLVDALISWNKLLDIFSISIVLQYYLEIHFWIRIIKLLFSKTSNIILSQDMIYQLYKRRNLFMELCLNNKFLRNIDLLVIKKYIYIYTYIYI